MLRCHAATIAATPPAFTITTPSPPSVFTAPPMPDFGCPLPATPRYTLLLCFRCIRRDMPLLMPDERSQDASRHAARHAQRCAGVKRRKVRVKCAV